jgi:transposase
MPAIRLWAAPTSLTHLLVDIIQNVPPSSPASSVSSPSPCLERRGIHKALRIGDSVGIDRSGEDGAMPRAYSNDLRKRVTDTVSSGASRHEAAVLFDIAVSTAVKWMQRLRDTGSSEAKPRGGSVSRLEKHTAEILAVVEERPDAILNEIVAVLHKQSIVTSRSALWRFLERHNITGKKKSLHAAEQHRKDVARARRKWIREHLPLAPMTKRSVCGMPSYDVTLRALRLMPPLFVSLPHQTVTSLPATKSGGYIG